MKSFIDWFNEENEEGELSEISIDTTIDAIVDWLCAEVFADPTIVELSAEFARTRLDISITEEVGSMSDDKKMAIYHQMRAFLEEIGCGIANRFIEPMIEPYEPKGDSGLRD
jgi:hypothetical protein